jgi:chromosomal replication initiator protein
VLDHIRVRVKPQQFETWFPQLRCLAIDPHEVRVATPNDFFRKWVETHYLAHLKEACFHALGAEPKITLLTEPREGGARAEDPPALPGASGGELAQAAVLSGGSAAPLSARGPREEPLRAEREAPAPRVEGDIQLNPQYVFEQFVVGPSNRLAHAASLAVSESPARTYNPLFLHGGVGMGKSHLLQAVCHSILARDPGLKVIYISCEGFVNQYIAALERRETERFRRRFRDVDMLLVDDVHFLASKEASQEEFFHTFNSLYNAQKQIILSSDSPPDIPSLEQRLVSRFKWGLVAEIEPPHFETKVAIIRAKAGQKGRALGDEVTRFLAESVDGNIREIEGAVNKVVVLAALMNRPIDVALCQEAIRELTRKPGMITLDDILNLVAGDYQVKVADLLSKRRTKSIALPRQVAMYLARMLTKLSLEEIGAKMGGRDHTTVLYAEEKIRALKAADAEMRARLERLKRGLERS